jgi:5-methylcytosine-specific restriction protein A
MARSSNYIDLSTRKGRNLFYQSPEWFAIRRIVLTKTPFCVECIKNEIYEISSEVDHIVDIKDAPAKCMDIDNLQALCKSCHSRKTFNNHISFQKKTYTKVNKKWDFIH